MSQSKTKRTAAGRALKARPGGKPADPIFARIKAHRAAEAAFNRAIDRENALEAKMDRVLRDHIRSGDAFIHVGTPIRPIKTRKELRQIKAEALNEFVGHFHCNGKVRHLNLVRKAIAGNIKRLHGELERARARVERVRERSGWNKAHDDWYRTSDAGRKALEKLITTQPTTPEGLAAFIDYLNEPANRDQLEGLDHGWLANVFTTIAKANVRARRAK